MVRSYRIEIVESLVSLCQILWAYICPIIQMNNIIKVMKEKLQICTLTHMQFARFDTKKQDNVVSVSKFDNKWCCSGAKIT